MSVQQEAKLYRLNTQGNKVPILCQCGQQRRAVILNIVTKAVLPCTCGRKEL